MTDTSHGRVTNREFDPSASPLGVAVTLVCGIVAVVATQLSMPAVVVTAVGAVVMPVAVGVGADRMHAIGACAAVVGVLLAGLGGTPPVLVLLGVTAAVLAWDVGEHALGLGRQIGRRAESRRAMVSHVLTSSGFAIALVVVSTAVFRLARGGQSVAAAVLLAGAAALLAVLID